MRLIITGATGLVGRALVRRCIANDKISHALVLTRKPLAEDVTKHPKVTVITHDDFSSYPSELLKQLAGAEGCLWAIGGRVTQFPDVETARRVQVDFPIAALKAFLAELAPPLAAAGKKFRFVFCSGMYAEWDQRKTLAFMQDTRRIKGQAEKGLCDLADENKDKIEVFIGRPSGILPEDAGSARKLVGMLFSAIGVDQVAAALTKIVLEGYPERIIENDALLKIQ